MKKLPLVVPVILSMAVLFGCRGDHSDNQSSVSSNSSSDVKQSAPGSNEGLTTAKVETAVGLMLDDFRLDGSVRVKGIQELPQQNAGIADLEFNGFQYAVTFEGGLLKKKDFKPQPMPKAGSRMPSMEEMFPPRKAVYSKDGKAILSRYTDGRWVLKEVRWGFDTGVKGSVEIR